MQEAFARTWAAFDRLRDPGDPLPYVRRAVVNLARSGLRRRRTARTTALQAVPDAVAADVTFAHDEARRELAGAVRALPAASASASCSATTSTARPRRRLPPSASPKDRSRRTCTARSPHSVSRWRTRDDVHRTRPARHPARRRRRGTPRHGRGVDRRHDAGAPAGAATGAWSSPPPPSSSSRSQQRRPSWSSPRTTTAYSSHHRPPRHHRPRRSHRRRSPAAASRCPRPAAVRRRIGRCRATLRRRSTLSRRSEHRKPRPRMSRPRPPRATTTRFER